jgi:hypothetical protein
MKNSNSLINLQDILNVAIKSENTSASISKVLLEAMRQTIVIDSPTIFDFYKIIAYAEHDVKCLGDSDMYLERIRDLQNVFICRNITIEPWSMVVATIKTSNIIDILSLLGTNIHKKNPFGYFEKGFLDSIRHQFNSISDEVRKSNLSSELKRFLLERISSIANAIDLYGISGAKALEEANKLMLFDISLKEDELTETDKKNPIFKKLISASIALKIILTPASIYEAIGILSLPAAIDDVSPRIGQFIKYQESIFESFDESINIHKAIKAPAITSPKEQEQEQKQIEQAKEQKQIEQAKGTK